MNARELEGTIRRHLLGQEIPRLVLDLSSVDYLSGAALRVIVRLSEELAARGGRLLIRDPQTPARLVLELAGLMSLIARAPD
jgi:anti-anti-sigma factor